MAMGPPPAPTKTRALPTRSTRTTRAATSPTNVDPSLTDGLDALSLDTRGVRPVGTRPKPDASLSRRIPSTSIRAESGTRANSTNKPLPLTSRRERAPAPPRTDDVAEAPTLSVDERAKRASAAINLALATLANLAKSGFRAEASAANAPRSGSATPTPSSRSNSSTRIVPSALKSASAAVDGKGSETDKDVAEAAAREAGKAFRVLRELGRDNVRLGNKRFSIEGMAGRFIAELTQIQLYRYALVELSAMRLSILSWYTSPSDLPELPPSSAPLLAHAASILLPLPPSSYFQPASLSETLSTSIRRAALQELVPLVLALQQSLVTVLFRSTLLSASVEAQKARIEKLEQVLRNDGCGEDGHIGGGPSDWEQLWRSVSQEQGLEETERSTTGQKVDASLLALFQTITTGTSNAEDKAAPELVLSLRIRALRYYSSTSTFPSTPLQLPAFHTQHRKILLRYGRSAQAPPYEYSSERIAREAGDAFAAVLQKLPRSKASQGEGGKEWTELCQVLLGLARKAGNASLISTVSAHLSGSESSSVEPVQSRESSHVPIPDTNVDPSQEASALISSLHRFLALFDLFTKSSHSNDAAETQALIGVLRRTPVCLRHAGQLLTTSPPQVETDRPRLSHSLAVDLDNAMHQVRSILNRFVRTPAGADPVPLRSDELVTLAGSSKPIPTPADPVLAEVHKLVRKSLDAFVSVAEQLAKVQDLAYDGGDSESINRARLMSAKGVETLILLAHDCLSISDRTTHAPTYAYLSRTLALLRQRSRLDSSPSQAARLDLRMDYTIYSVASVFYNVAARLFSANWAEGAAKFARQSCLLTRETLDEIYEAERSEADELVAGIEGLDVGKQMSDGQADLDKDRQEAKREKARRDDRAKIRQDLEKNAGRRWELLGLAQHVVGDKKAAHEAYFAAILAQTPVLLSQLSVDSGRHPMSHLVESYGPLVKLVERVTKLSTFDLLLAPDEVSLAKTIAESSQTLSPDVQGAILEFQLNTLDQVLEQIPSQRATSAILASLKSVYTAEQYPLRRARVLVRALQQLCIGDRIAEDLEPAALAAEIDELCTTHIKTGHDHELAAFSTQYLAISHLYLGFHAHHSRVGSLSSVVEAEARNALSILQTSLEGDLPASPSHPIAPQSKVTFQASPVRSPTTTVIAAPPVAARRRTTRAAAATPAKAITTLKTPQRTRAIATTRKAAPPTQDQITPPKKDPLETCVQIKPTVHRGDGSKANLDDPAKVFRLLETMAQVLGTLGFSLLKMSFLKLLRRLSAKLDSDRDAAFVTSSTYLAREYLLLGKTMRAGTILAQAEQRANSDAQPDASSEIFRLLTHAEYFAMIGNHDKAARTYEAAMKVADSVPGPQGKASVTTRIVEMTLILQRVALASSVYSTMLQRKGDLARALMPALQAMRLCDRALSNISRLEPHSDKGQDASSTFDAPERDPSAPLKDMAAVSSSSRYRIASGGAYAALAWQLADQLAQSILRVSSLHLVRGSPKDAEFYATQAIDLARNIASDRLVARATALRAEVRILLNRWEEAGTDLEQMDTQLGSATCPEAIEVRRLGADLLLRNSLPQEAYNSLTEAQKQLEFFGRCAAEAETTQTSVRRSISAKSLSPEQQRSAAKTLSPFNTFSSPNGRSGKDMDWILPASQASMLRMQVSLLRLQKKVDESQIILRRLSKLSSREEDRADELLLLASLHLQDMLSRCTSDPVLGMLPDSVLSIPAMGISLAASVVKIGTPRTGPTILNSLKDVDGLLVRAAAYSASRSQPNKLRELSLITGTIRTFHANVAKSSKRAALSVSHLLDLGTAVTLRREMLDAIDFKLAKNTRQDDLLWPTSVAEEELAGEAGPERRLLVSMRDRYRLETPEPALTDASLSSVLPPKWSTISLHLSTERDNLIIVRHRRDSEPVVFKLPLDRLARREGEDEFFTYDDAVGELRNIVASTKASSQNAKHVKTREEREAWWQERQELDNRLKELLQMIEDNWLGAFKSVFYDARCHTSEDFGSFKSRIERILKRGIVRATNDKKTTRFKLNDAIVECVAGLPATSREEDLEDLFFFMTEAFQFSGVPVACDETDVDQIVVDLREALEELHGTRSAPRGRTDPDEHTFLVLDKTLAGFPWESLPCLLGRSVSRLPSISFLRDRIDLASSIATADSPCLEIAVDSARAAFVLNPGGDLAATQRTFEPWLSEKAREANWDGIVGRAPQEEEVKAFLASKDLFLYFGHGGAEQYIRRKVIRNLPKCAVTMLWGCSSGILKDQGDFDPVGTPYNYMIAGASALVANLWDVTDKDIDKFAQSVFAKTGLSATSSASSTAVSLTSAVAQSRHVCNLRYLNGAAPVVWGIPVRFQA